MALRPVRPVIIISFEMVSKLIKYCSKLIKYCSIKSILLNPQPVPYSDHQYYDGMNEFNDRYSFEAPAQQAPQNYNNEYSGDYVAGNQDYNR